MIVYEKPFEIPANWSEKAICKALADRTVNQKDAFGITPLAAAMLEAHCAWGEESGQHWIKLAEQLLDAGATVLTDAPQPFYQKPDRNSSGRDSWTYTSPVNGKSFSLKSSHYDPFFHVVLARSYERDVPDPEYDPKSTLAQGWMLGPLLRLGDKNLSKRVLATLSDDQYADLVSGVLMLHNKLLHVEQLSFDPRFDATIRRIEPKRLARTLEAAVSDENMELFDRLLLPGVPLDYEHSDDMPPLHWACYRENMPMIDKLLTAGASPNYPCNGVTPFVYAATQATDPRYLRALTEKGLRIAPDPKFVNNVTHHGYGISSDKNEFTDAEKRDLVVNGGHSQVFKREVACRIDAGLYTNPSLNDTILELHQKFIVPAILAEFDKTATGRKKLKELKVFPSDFYNYKVYSTLISSLVDSRHTLTHHYHEQDVNERPEHDAEDAIIDLFALHHTQNHPNIAYPVGEFEKAFSFEWEPITVKSYRPTKTAKEYTVECLTTSEELRAESDAMGHCVGKSGYDQQCSFGSYGVFPHIFSIRRKGVPVSTFEIKLHDKDDKRYDKHIVGDYSVEIVQHRGLQDRKPSPEARRVLDQWLDDAKKGLIEFNNKQGILPENHELYEVALAEYLKDKNYTKEFYESAAKAGTRITTPQDAEIAFEDAMRDVRRASERTGRDGKLIYSDHEPGDQKGMQHLISGTYITPEAQGKTHAVRYRDMSYREWLRATGISENIIRPIIRENYPEVAKRMEKIWQREDATPIVGEMKGKRDGHANRPGWLHRQIEERSAQLEKEDRREWRKSSSFGASGQTRQ